METWIYTPLASAPATVLLKGPVILPVSWSTPHPGYRLELTPFHYGINFDGNRIEAELWRIAGGDRSDLHRVRPAGETPGL